ncbi:MAG: site-specific integrase [Candidatus Gastranaerophilales bacterium]|nr:site-specific integrase [Candidatus Gastranaerophilales bacterium]
MTTVEPIRKISDLEKVRRILRRSSFRDYFLFTLGINSGLRICDMLALNVGDVKGKNYIELVEKKTGKYKKFPINYKLKALIEEYTKDKKVGEPLFASCRKHRLDRITAYNIIKKACKKAGIEECVGTHTMRKTFGYHHYQRYNNIAMLQKMFNHSSMEITLRYIGIEQEQIYCSYNNFIL